MIVNLSDLFLLAACSLDHVSTWCPFTLALTGGTTRAQLDAAAATAAELGLELAPVELQYRVFFTVGNVSFRVVDPSAAHVKAEVRWTLVGVLHLHLSPAPI